MCGGVFISDKWVMTAGHCAYRYSAHHIIIIHGLTSLTGFQVPTGNWASVNSVHVHDQYSSFTNMYDVALLELRNKVDFSAGNRWPICLPANDFCLSNSEFVTVTGWGAQSEGGSASQTLRKVNVPVMTSSACVNKMASIGRFVNPQTMMCAGGEEGEDACQGDSGGPLTYRNSDSVHTLVGLVSWGVGCAREGTPGIYVRITYMLEWVKSISQVDNDGENGAMACGDDFNNFHDVVATTARERKMLGLNGQDWITIFTKIMGK